MRLPPFALVKEQIDSVAETQGKIRQRRSSEKSCTSTTERKAAWAANRVQRVVSRLDLLLHEFPEMECLRGEVKAMSTLAADASLSVRSVAPSCADVWCVILFMQAMAECQQGAYAVKDQDVAAKWRFGSLLRVLCSEKADSVAKDARFYKRCLRSARDVHVLLVASGRPGGGLHPRVKVLIGPSVQCWSHAVSSALECRKASVQKHRMYGSLP